VLKKNLDGRVRKSAGTTGVRSAIDGLRFSVPGLFFYVGFSLSGGRLDWR